MKLRMLFLILLFIQPINVLAQNTNSWVQKFKADYATYINIVRDSPNIVYAMIDTNVRTTNGVGSVYKSTDYGENWQYVVHSPNFGIVGFPWGNLRVAPDSSNYVYAFGIGKYSDGSTFYYSTDGGTNWIMTALEGEYGPSCTIEIPPSKPNIVYVGLWVVTELRFYRSEDRGKTWEKRSIIPYIIPTSLAVHPYNSQILYMGGQGGIIHKSIDGGSNWTQLYLSDSVATLITGIVIDPHNPETVYVGTEHYGMFKTTNGGQSWESINNGLSFIGFNPQDWRIITALAINPKTPNELFLGYSRLLNDNGRSRIYTKLYRTTNSGDNWEEFNTGLPDSVAGINSIEIDTSQQTERIYVGINGAPTNGGNREQGGIYVYETSTSVVQPFERPKVVPEVFKLFQNYPNPFNPTTNISYQLAQTNKVKLTIYNSLGKEVKILMNEVQSNGYYTIRWNGRDDMNKEVSSGVYFYQLQIEGEKPQKETKKMLLIK